MHSSSMLICIREWLRQKRKSFLLSGELNLPSNSSLVRRIIVAANKWSFMLSRRCAKQLIISLTHCSLYQSAFFESKFEVVVRCLELNAKTALSSIGVIYALLTISRVNCFWQSFISNSRSCKQKTKGHLDVVRTYPRTKLLEEVLE